jgi:very-short-patch-repair endonuclease
MWGALLRAGPGAVFSHQTAAELQGFLHRPSPAIHVTVPADRHPARWSTIPGVVIHRSSVLESTRHPVSSVPCTKVEDTVLDLVSVSESFDEKFDWISRALGERLTTPDRLFEALERRRKFPDRRAAMLALGYAREGIMSWLELQWVTGVERPHGLPTALRQVRVRQATGNRYLDNLYEEYRVCVELDGRAAHPEADRRRDNARDRWNLTYERVATMRFDTESLHGQQRKCVAAAEVAKVLRESIHDHDRRSNGTIVGHPCDDPLCQEAWARIMGVHARFDR